MDAPMPRTPSAELSSDQLREIEKRIVEDANDERLEAAWEGVESLLAVQGGREDVALALLRIVDDRHLPREKSLEVLGKVYDAHHRNESILALVGGVLESARTRGRFNEGVAANRAAQDLAGERDEAIEWNLGICATGAGEAGVALQVWKRMEQRIEIGRFGLPDGSYARCKVRLAQRPLATSQGCPGFPSPGHAPQEPLSAVRLRRNTGRGAAGRPGQRGPAGRHRRVPA
jgi:hypothetical protein